MRRTINVEHLARVEGEGALTIRMNGCEVDDVQLRIFEPPRFFEAFLRGRAFSEAPDITARICGICPVAYQMSACHALEDALGVNASRWTRQVRRLLYCGEWIQSHCLHMFLLHAPDFLGYPDAVAMSANHGSLVARGLRMKKVGNDLMAAVGGRAVHPINVKVGGFYSAPEREALEALIPELTWARDAAVQSVTDFAGLDFPDLERDYEFVAMRSDGEYPFCEGRIVSTRGLDIDLHEYDDTFEERQVPHSTALHSVIKGRDEYFCGPLARININFDLLRPAARDAAAAIGFEPPCRNPFKSLIARALEVVHAFEEALALIAEYAEPSESSADVPAVAGTGCGCTEAPRGILFHRYTLDEEGLIRDAKIVPPTSQNQKTIESDLRALAARLAVMPQEEATWLAEWAVRNYDPCISCSTHFLKLRIDRG